MGRDSQREYRMESSWGTKKQEWLEKQREEGTEFCVDVYHKKSDMIEEMRLRKEDPFAFSCGIG